MSSIIIAGEVSMDLPPRLSFSTEDMRFCFLTRPTCPQTERQRRITGNDVVHYHCRGGIYGLTAALELLHRGHAVLLFDPAHLPTDGKTKKDNRKRCRPLSLQGRYLWTYRRA